MHKLNSRHIDQAACGMWLHIW